MLEMTIAAKSDVGNVKKINQDGFLCKIGTYNESDFGLFVICDGVGGLSNGEIASEMVITAFDNWWNNELKTLINTELENTIIDSLLDKLKMINTALINFANSENINLGTTASILFILKSKYYIVHVGDSRIYEIKNEIKQLTKDHTHYELLKEQGKFEELKNTKKNVLTQCIGVKEDITIQTKQGIIDEACKFILCSDGFYNRINEENILSRLTKKNIKSKLLQKYCEDFVDQIKNSGERDNITVMILKIDFIKKGIFSRFKNTMTGGR